MLERIDLGTIGYAAAYDRQLAEHARVLAWRDAGDDHADSGPDQPNPAPPGVVLALEHHSVITVSKRAAAASHILASPERLAAQGIELHQTDRGGDVTYHGPGQLVLYPILDLRRLKLNLHAYMRLLEQLAINTCARFNLTGSRDDDATGVWIKPPTDSPLSASPPSHTNPAGAKICALGVRVRRWVSMHGIALNVQTNLDHFGTIVPCGLAGRPVTSMLAELGKDHAPTVDAVKAAALNALDELIADRAQSRPTTTTRFHAER